MKTYMFLAMLWLTASCCYSQILFEPGYFIDNSGKKTECLIRNSDWKNNPDRFRYKMSTNSDVQTLEIGMVKVFSIHDKLKFARHTVDIDRRSYLAKDLSVVRDPIFQKEQLFLKVLVEGTADLFSYEDGNLVRYFYRLEEQKPQQLVYTRYKTEGRKTIENFSNYGKQGQKIHENFYYKSQLAQDLKCEGITSTYIDETAYTADDLIAYFSRYNDCIGQEYSVLREERADKQFHLRIRPGIYLYAFSVQYHPRNVPDTDFGQNPGFRIGAELEMVLPFNGNKWAITFEPFFRSYKAENNNDTHAEYSSLVTAIGLRHYFYLGGESKIFINGNFGFDFPFKSDFRAATSLARWDLEVPNKVLGNYWALGTGFNWNDKVSIELRYMFNQDLLMQYEYWTSDLSGPSVILGYNLF